jgi:hypothetical protein
MKPLNCEYFRFPSDPETCEKWVQILREGGKADNWVPNENSKVCALHFPNEVMRDVKQGQSLPLGTLPMVPPQPRKEVILFYLCILNVRVVWYFRLQKLKIHKFQLYIFAQHVYLLYACTSSATSL